MMKHRIKMKLQRGVSLLEVMMTAFVVVVGLLVVMSSFVAMAKSNRYSERMDIANSLLQLEMEQIRNQPYASIASVEGEYSVDFPDHPDFRKEVIVNDMGNIKKIVVNIYFEKDRRRAQATTMVAKL